MIRHIVAGSMFVSMIACLHCQGEDPKKTEAVSAVECSGESCPMPTTRAEVKPKVEEVGNEEVVKERMCPEDMVHIRGQFCPQVQQHCLHWRNNVAGERCEVWENPVKCISKTVSKDYCIDTYEYPNKKGELPRDWMNWYDAKYDCEVEGKRLCTDSEWTFSSEGPNMHPYGYGDGYHRDATICNFDNHAATVGLTGAQIMAVRDPNSETAIKLRSLLVPSGSKEQCVSDWGVHDLPGNIDEWVLNESARPYVSALKGGHTFGVRCASRPTTWAHGPSFKWYESGFRCCSSVRTASDKQKETK